MNDIDFLKDILQKQFSLANCTETIDDVLAMDITQQTEFWNKYTLTEEQFTEWKSYFISQFKEYQPEVDSEEIMMTVFDDLTNQWAFEIVKTKKRGRKKKTVVTSEGVN